MSLILGPDGTPITSESRTQSATPTASLRGADLQVAYPGVRDAWGESVNDPAVRNGWTYAGANGQALPLGQYGLIREFERRRCRAAYFQNALFRGAVQIIAAFLSGDAFSYADPDDKTAALALEEFWQANNLGELFSERWLIEYLLDGENATLFPERDAGPDLPSRVAFLDVDRTFRLESSTAFGTVASDMVQSIHVSTSPGVEEPYLLGRFTWTANDALWNDPRGWPVAMGAVDPALAYVGLLNHRLNVHGLQSRVLGVYKAALNPAGTDANGTPDGGLHQWRLKTGAFRQLPPQGGIVPLVVKPGYTDANGNRYDGFSEDLDFPKPASGASDASTDQRAFLRLVGLAMGGLPEHWLGEGGNVNRATAGEMGTPAVRLALRRQGTGRGYLDRLIRTELNRRFGRERLYTVYRTTYKADGLTRVRRRLRVPADLLEINWQFPSLTEETLDTLIRRALAADARGWASPQTLSGSVGFDPAAEQERMAAVGLTFGQARQLPVTPGGDSNEPTPTNPVA